MTRTIDLNADLGEGCGDDGALIGVVTSCNVACGGHAGDERSMAEALTLAREAGVAAGAHPSYPDKDGFGRRSVETPLDALETSLNEQIDAIAGVAARLGVELTHVKPHGALYNDAAKDAEKAARVIAAAKRLPRAAIVGPPMSALARAADGAALRFVAEGFADRAYEPDGSLRSRRLDGALIEDEARRADQALSLAQAGEAAAHGGGRVRLAVDTICLHGDSPGALSSARAIRSRLEGAGIVVRAHS